MVGALSLALASCATIPTPEEANDAVLMLRRYESSAWALGIVLIWADVVLPIPQTAVIAALGIIYGALIGGLLGSFGLITAHVLHGADRWQRTHRIRLCRHRRWLASPADRGPRGELRAPGVPAAHRALCDPGEGK
jgi:hypothetical protein